MTNHSKYPLFDLSAAEFERLCVELLAREGMLYIGMESNLSFDFVAQSVLGNGSTRNTAVEVKHRKSFSMDDLKSFIDKVSHAESSHFNYYVLMTSAPLNDAVSQQLATHYNNQAEDPHALPFRVLGQTEILELLNKNPTVAEKFFKSVRKRVVLQDVYAWSSIVAMAFSVIAGIVGNFAWFHVGDQQEKTSFENQIIAVEQSLNGLRTLEQNLQKLKVEMEQTDQDSARIRKDYENALKLKSVTTEQLEQIKKAVVSQDTWDVAWNYFLGFILGIAASVLATVITDRWKKNKALSEP